MITIDDIDGDKRPTFQVKLVGKEYVAHLPKMVILTELSAIGEQVRELDSSDPALAVLSGKLAKRLVQSMFRKRVGEKVLERLQDPTDSLDIEHVMTLLERLTEAAAGDTPTTSSSGSSDSDENTN